jgi:hypothetical protein
MKRKHFILFAWFVQFLLGCDTTSNVEDPSKSYFLKFYGGDGDQTGDDMVTLADGTFVLFGTSRPSGTGKPSQWYFVKADAKGMILKEKFYGSPTLDETASDIELTADGKLVAVGNVYKAVGDGDVRIMILDFDLNPLDSAVVALKNSALQDTDENAISVSLTSDGFIVAGSTTNLDLKPPSSGPTGDQLDALHLRFFNDLTPYGSSWRQAHGPGTVDAAIKVVQISPTLFYLFGYSNTVAGHPTTDSNFWMIGLGADGEGTNFVSIGSTTDDERLSSMCTVPVLSGDGYFLGGITYTSTGASDIYVLKLRKDLAFNQTDAQFSKPLSIRLGTNVPVKTSVFASQQGGFFVLANENSFNNDQNWILTKVGTDGSPTWSLPIVFGGEGPDACGAVQELPDGRVMLIGTMRTGKPDAGELKMTLIKVNRDGKFAN